MSATPSGVTDFQIVTALLGGLLMLGAVVSRVAQRSFLALTPLFVLLGFLLGRGGLHVLDFDPEIVKLAIFVVFGSLLTVHGLFGDGPAAIAIVLVTLLVARPGAVWLALVGTRVSTHTKAFMARFVPKGVATMTFALLVLAEGFDSSEQLFNLAALVVFVSTIAHGLTDKPGVDWIARRGSTASQPP